MGDFDWDLETTRKTVRGDGGKCLGRIDKYELTRELGGGGFGSVYLARDTVARIDRAVKGLPPEVKGNPEELENVRENFALVSRLHHPHIAAALDLHPAESVQYFDDGAREKLRVAKGETLLVMEYAPGVTLSQWRKQFPGRRVPLPQAVESRSAASRRMAVCRLCLSMVVFLSDIISLYSLYTGNRLKTSGFRLTFCHYLLNLY